jgi:hypothetical protein
MVMLVAGVLLRVGRRTGRDVGRKTNGDAPFFCIRSPPAPSGAFQAPPDHPCDGFNCHRRGKLLLLQRPPGRVDDRIRTGDRLDHNQELYQLSYSHHVRDLQEFCTRKPATPILRQCGDTRGLEAITPLPGEKWQLRRSVSNRHPEPNVRLRPAGGSAASLPLPVRR